MAHTKYIWLVDLMDWFRQQHRVNNSISNIWKVVINAIPLIREGITWRIKEGNAIHIGTDPWIGYGNAHRFPTELLRYLHNRDIAHIRYIGDTNNSTILQQAWKIAQDLDIPIQWHQDWYDYMEALTQAHIRLMEGPNKIV